jgi:ABC-type phosphate/phosphonate transport system substrate-binding protein
MKSKPHPARAELVAAPASGLRRGLLGAGALAWAGCGLPRAAWAQTAAGALSIGVLPNVSARILLASYQPMREYFERELRQPVSIVTAPDFRAFAASSLKGEYDIVVTAPNLGRVMQLDAKWEPLAIYEPRIPAVAVARADNPDDSPRQLRGRSLALANPQSLVALVGLQWLKSEGLQEGVDFKTVVAANDDSLGAVLRSGEAPWAVMSMGEFRAKPEALRQSLREFTSDSSCISSADGQPGVYHVRIQGSTWRWASLPVRGLAATPELERRPVDVYLYGTRRGQRSLLETSVAAAVAVPMTERESRSR